LKGVTGRIGFIGNFRDFALYNNWSVTQDPSCTFYASEFDWSN